MRRPREVVQDRFVLRMVTKETRTPIGMWVMEVVNAGRLDLAVQHACFKVSEWLARGKLGTMAEVRLIRAEGYDFREATAEELAQRWPVR